MESYRCTNCKGETFCVRLSDKEIELECVKCCLSFTKRVESDGKIYNALHKFG